MSAFDDELEAEVGRVLERGAEGRRAHGVEALQQGSQAGLVLRVGGVALGIAAVLALYYGVGAALALHSLESLCRAVGLCS